MNLLFFITLPWASSIFTPGGSSTTAYPARQAESFHVTRSYAPSCRLLIMLLSLASDLQQTCHFQVSNFQNFDVIFEGASSGFICKRVA
jgi:hypothetical protein